MKFEWDHNKSARNVSKHKVSFNQAALIFSDSNILSFYDEDHSDEEDRWISLGKTPFGDLLVVIHAYRRQNGDDEIVRIISARFANKHEMKQYYEKA